MSYVATRSSEIQGDENAVGMTSTQQGGVVDEEPYENLIDEASMQSVMNEESSKVARYAYVLCFGERAERE